MSVIALYVGAIILGVTSLLVKEPCYMASALTLLWIGVAQK